MPSHAFTVIPVVLIFVFTLIDAATASSPMAGQKEAKVQTPARSKNQAKPATDLDQKVDQLVHETMAGLHIPGISIAIVRDGKVVRSAAYGLSVVEHSVKAKPDTVYLLASITKAFTATGIMMLVEEGKISLDSPISTYLPDTPEEWKPITVRNLLTHTAGLKDRFEGHTSADWLLSFTTQQMYDSARKQPLDFPPGTRLQYSDQGFFLLGMIIEKVSAESYRAFMTERIFKPLGMTRTTTVNQREVVTDLASGYALFGATLIHNHRRTDYGIVSHFGIISTALDMAKFDAALYSEKLLKRTTLEQMWTPALLTSGETVSVGAMGSYGFGWFLDDFFGHQIVQHGGSTGTAFWRLPSDKLTIIVLTNLEQLSGGDATSIAKDIARIYIPDLAWTAHKPVADPNPERTAKLKQEVIGLGTGTINQAMYMYEYGAAVKSALAGAKKFYDSIGPLKEFQFLGSTPVGKGHKLYYRATYEKAVVNYSIVLTGTGLITSMVGEPQ